MTFTSSLGWSFAYKPIESALFEALSPCAESRREHFNTRDGNFIGNLSPHLSLKYGGFP